MACYCCRGARLAGQWLAFDAWCYHPRLADVMTLWNAFNRITAGCSEIEKLALYSGTARRFYIASPMNRNRGVDGSNPAPSSGESANPRSPSR
jgi:hypothetical protein